MAFRDFTFPTVQERLGLRVVDVDHFSGASPFPVREGFAAFVRDGTALILAYSTEEAKSEFIIARDGTNCHGQKIGHPTPMKMGPGVAMLHRATRGAEAGIRLVHRARERTWPDPDPTDVGPHPVAPGPPGSTQNKLLHVPGSPREAASPRGRSILDVLHARCAGLDVHKKTVVACVRSVGPGGEVTREVRTFATMTADLIELADWLARRQVRHLAMESTGVYWKPVWHLLEDRFEMMLINAGHYKQVPGRKTDVKDAEWIAQLLQHGLLSPSFVPPPPVRELRDLTRQRAQLIAERATAANRVQKVLEAANIKLASVASDVLGASGRAMIAGLIAGETDPARLAEEARGSLRKKVIPLKRALEGRVTEHHRFQLQLLMDQIGQLEGLIGRLDARIAEVMGATAGEGQPAPFREAAGRLATIPGIASRSAEVIVAEIGPDMSKFATAGHLASWAGLCPGHDQSAGRRRSGRTTKGSVWLRSMLVQVAWSASHTKGTILSETYRKAVRRLGKKKALVALGHKILRIIYEMLKEKTDYVERLRPGQAA